MNLDLIEDRPLNEIGDRLPSWVLHEWMAWVCQLLERDEESAEDYAITPYSVKCSSHYPKSFKTALHAAIPCKSNNNFELLKWVL